MSLLPVFQNRDFTSKLDNNRLAWTVNSLEWEAIGGCSQATLSANGPELDLWELVEYLRCPVVMQDEIARPIWWGFVSEVRVRVGAIEVGVTLDSMSNRVAVTYSFADVTTGIVGQRKTTAWSVDAESVAEYGTKEWLASASGLSDASALARRDTILAAKKFPSGVTSFNPGASRGRGSVEKSATLICSGWFDTLEWKYATWASVTGPSYSGAFSSVYFLGDVANNTKRLQQFTVGSAALNVVSVQVAIYKAGTPVDNVVLGVYALDTAGNPTGSALGSGSIAGGTLTTSAAWYTIDLSDCELSASTMYGLQFSRSGAVDASNYYAIVAVTGYAGGISKRWNGSAWVDVGADAYFIFGVNNSVETTKQINDLAIAFGQFFAGVDIDSSSGVSLPSYRDGDTTAMDEIRALLEAGGPNKRRYLAEVTDTRRLHVWEEPAVVETYYLNRRGELSNATGTMIIPYLPPVGVWARLKDVIPASADTSKITDPTLQFIEAATWNPDNGLNFRFRGQPSIDEVMRMK